ncbi:FG-GAP repeat protein [Polystyrenella longa]|uniref:FG-GAP repeat protein n=1 Tax=Polystyrenella longa TaxID=2528007 RepID=A0A518CTP7_9PLAN|nr:FG-GAP-like repeat-containing protein [Polystyrenella longa]QDU82544.1 FG-GAP repeat protein [Polystyrenella longa]
MTLSRLFARFASPFTSVTHLRKRKLRLKQRPNGIAEILEARVMLSASGISIDGDFSDWASIPSYTDPADDQHDTDHDQQGDTPSYVDHPDVDLLEYKVTHDEENFYFYARATGEIGATQQQSSSPNLRAGRYYVIVTIDLDNDDSTGYWLHEGGYFPTTDGYDMNAELEFYDGSINTGHYLLHAALNDTELQQDFADQSNNGYVWNGPQTQGPFDPGFVGLKSGDYDHYTQWVYKDNDPANGGQDSVTFVQDKGPVVSGIINFAQSANGSELEMIVPFKGFLKDQLGNPIVSLGNTVDLSFSLEASGELSNEVGPGNQNGTWASDTGDPINGYVLTTPKDYGDAPDSYSTLIASGGASHLGSSLYLGAGVDTEFDGKPDSNAALDTLDDGITSLSALIAGEAVTGTFTASGAGYLNAWMDYNQDGDFDDIGEQFAVDQAVVAGSNNLNFNIPLAATTGQTYARLRLSSQSGISFNGEASDGEVEDYYVTISSAEADLVITKSSSPESVAQGETTSYSITVSNNGPSNVTGANVVDTFNAELENVTWTAAFSAGASGNANGSGNINELVDLANGATITYTVTGKVKADATPFVLNRATVTAPALVTDSDLSNNSDYDIDVITITTTPSLGEFVEGVIAPGVNDGDFVKEVVFGDLDGDGDDDAVFAFVDGGHQIWFFDQTAGVLVDSGQALAIESTPASAHHALGTGIADFNNDGYLDILVLVKSTQAVYLNDGAGNFNTPGLDITGISSLESYEIELEDLDGDGDMDVVVADDDGLAFGGTGNNLLLFNDGTGHFPQITSLPMTTSDDDTRGTTAGDFNGDGFVDIVFANFNAGQSSEIWFNDGSGSFTKGSEDFGGNRHWNVEKGDFDNDGDLDLMWVVNSGDPDYVELWNNDGAGNFTYSGQRTLTNENGQGGIEGIQVGDLDGDGDLDAFFSTFGVVGTIQTWENDGAGNFSTGFVATFLTPTPPDTAGGWRARLGDVDGDGDLDAFVFEGLNEEVHYFENKNNVSSPVTFDTPERLISFSTKGQQRTGVGGQHSIASAADGRYVTTWWSDEGDGSGTGVFAQLYRADGSKVGGPFIVSTTTSQDQFNPSVTMQDNGQFTIVWQTDADAGPGVNWEIHAQRYLASGLLDGGEMTINSETLSHQTMADVVYLANGSFAVTWTGKGPGDANGVFARIFNAAGVPQGAEFLVNQTTAGAQLNPSLTADSAGGFAVVWQGNGTGDSEGVFYRRFNNLGSPLTSEVRVNATTAGTQDSARVTQAANGDFIVVWSGAGPGDTVGVFARRLTSAGALTGSEVLINTQTSGQQVTPSVVADYTGGGFLVVWSHQLSGNDYDIKLRHVNGSDTPTGSSQTVNQVLDNRQWNPTVIQRPTAGGDQFVVAWSGYGDGDTAGVFTRAVDTSLVPVTDETLVSSSTTGQQRTGVGGQHASAAAADGRYITTWWSDEGDGDGAGVFGLLYRADGSKVGGPFIVSTTTAQDQINPSVTMQDNGKFMIVWQSDSDPGAGVNWEIHAQRYLASGLLDGGEIVVNSETISNQSLADVVYLANGSFVVTWTGKGPTDANGVFARLFNAAGVPQGTEFQVNATDSGAQTNPSLTTDSAGGFAVVWHGNGTGDSAGVYFRRFSNTGTPLTGEVRVNATTTGTQETARVTQVANGDFIVTWSGEGTGDAAGVFTRRLSPAGALTGSEVLVNSQTSGQQVTPSVVADYTGDGFVIVWSDQISGNDYDIKLRRFDGSDTAISDSIIVNQELPGRQWNPSVIQRSTTSGDRFLVIWSGNGIGDSAGVFTRQLHFEEPVALLALSEMSDQVFADSPEELLT